jgi:N-methylhydantoinase B
VIRRVDGTEQVINSKTVERLGPGDRVLVETAGGGGYGDPETRGSQENAADMADRKTAST